MTKQYKTNESGKIDIERIRNSHVTSMYYQRRCTLAPDVLLDKCINEIEPPRSLRDLALYAREIQYYYETRVERDGRDYVLTSVNLDEYSVYIQIINPLPYTRIVVERKLIFPIKAEVVSNKTLRDLLKELFPERSDMFVATNPTNVCDVIRQKCSRQGIDADKCRICDIPKISEIARDYFDNIYHKRTRHAKTYARMYELGYTGKSLRSLIKLYKLSDNDIGTKRYQIFMDAAQIWISRGKPKKINDCLTTILKEMHFFEY